MPQVAVAEIGYPTGSSGVVCQQGGLGGFTNLCICFYPDAASGWGPISDESVKPSIFCRSMYA